MAEQNEDLFSKLGIDIGKNKINIDITQTKDFFNTLRKTFEATAQNIQKDISEGKIDMSENVGIKINKENINIDLEKTKSFIEDLGKKIEVFIAEIDKSVDNIGKK
jgi:formiminotetrahydrofolate cyclodeaminase